jgi:hypothetical protein
MIADSKDKQGRSLGTDFYLIDELLLEEERSIRDEVRAHSATKRLFRSLEHGAVRELRLNRRQ